MIPVLSLAALMAATATSCTGADAPGPEAGGDYEVGSDPYDGKDMLSLTVECGAGADAPVGCESIVFPYIAAFEGSTVTLPEDFRSGYSDFAASHAGQKVEVSVGETSFGSMDLDGTDPAALAVPGVEESNAKTLAGLVGAPEPPRAPGGADISPAPPAQPPPDPPTPHAGAAQDPASPAPADG